MTIACSGEAPVAVLVKMIFLGEEVDEKRNILDIANTGLCLPLHFASHLHSDPDVIKLLVSHFGEARAADLSRTMTSVGTPIYVAPEVMRGNQYDSKCNSYSFGICLVAMCW